MTLIITTNDDDSNDDDDNDGARGMTRRERRESVSHGPANGVGVGAGERRRRRRAGRGGAPEDGLLDAEHLGGVVRDVDGEVEAQGVDGVPQVLRRRHVYADAASRSVHGRGEARRGDVGSFRRNKSNRTLRAPWRRPHLFNRLRQSIGAQ